MKKIFVSLGILFGCLSVSAAEPQMATPSSQWSQSVSELLMSKYYGSIFGGTFYPGPMSFTDFAASRRNLYGSITFDLSLGQKLNRIRKYNQDGGNEYDFTADQSFQLGSKSHPVFVDAGVCYLAVNNLRQMKDDAFEEFVRLDLPLGTSVNHEPVIQPYVEFFHYQTVGGFKDNGWFTYGGVFRDQKLGCALFSKELVLNVDYRVGVCQGAFSGKVGIEYHRLALSLPIHGKKWTVVPSVIGQITGDSHQTFVHKDEIFGTLQFKRGF